jgi:hypothetical protein
MGAAATAGSSRQPPGASRELSASLCPLDRLHRHDDRRIEHAAVGGNDSRDENAPVDLVVEAHRCECAVVRRRRRLCRLIEGVEPHGSGALRGGRVHDGRRAGARVRGDCGSGAPDFRIGARRLIVRGPQQHERSRCREDGQQRAERHP